MPPTSSPPSTRSLAVHRPRTIHESWHIAWAAAGILAGALIAAFLPPTYLHNSAWLVAAIILLFIAIMRRTPLALMLALFGGISLGLCVGARAQADVAYYQQISGETVEVSGSVSDDTNRTQSGEQRLTLTDIQIHNQPRPGTIWASVASDVEIKRGDTITIAGDIQEGFGTRHAALYSATLIDIQRPTPGDVTRVARDNFSHHISQHIQQPQASLGVSFLVGQRQALSEFIQDIFRDLGLVHLVVASGFHLTIVVRFARRLFERHSNYLALASSLLLIGGFLVLTGYSTSMVRAALVTSLSLLAWYFGRAIHPVILLLVVAAATVLINPLYIIGDMAWHLSFAAFAGVILLAPLLHAYFWHPEKEPGFFRYLLIATLSAQLTTFPIIALTFEQYSPLALLANVLVLPVVPPVMLGTFFVGVSSFVFDWFAAFIAVPTQIGLSYITTVVEYLASLPWAVGSIQIDYSFVAAYYVVLIIIMVYLQRATQLNLRRHNPV